mgnify:CR=1 FL=1
MNIAITAIHLEYVSTGVGFFAGEVGDRFDVQLEFVVKLGRKNFVNTLDDGKFGELIGAAVEDPSYVGDIVGFNIMEVEPDSGFAEFADDKGIIFDIVESFRGLEIEEGLVEFAIDDRGSDVFVVTGCFGRELYAI